MKKILQIFFLAVFVIAISVEGQTALQTVAAGIIAITSFALAAFVTKLPEESK